MEQMPNGTDLETVVSGIYNSPVKDSMTEPQQATIEFIRGYWFGFNKGLEIGRKMEVQDGSSR